MIQRTNETAQVAATAMKTAERGRGFVRNTIGPPANNGRSKMNQGSVLLIGLLEFEAANIFDMGCLTAR
jgi:hypothetical protein